MSVKFYHKNNQETISFNETLRPNNSIHELSHELFNKFNNNTKKFILKFLVHVQCTEIQRTKILVLQCFCLPEFWRGNIFMNILDIRKYKTRVVYPEVFLSLLEILEALNVQSYWKRTFPQMFFEQFPDLLKCLLVRTPRECSSEESIGLRSSLLLRLQSDETCARQK